MNHYNFYDPLLKIKEEAYALFKDKTGHPPKGPDSSYSPFNPLNPLYELFTELKLKNLPKGKKSPPLFECAGVSRRGQHVRGPFMALF